MSSLFFLAFLLYLTTFIFADATVAFKFLMFGRDMLILGLITQLIKLTRSRPFLVLLLAIGIYGLLQFAGFGMLMNTFPQVKTLTVPIDDQYELLIETKKGEITPSYERIIRKFELDVKPAFQPQSLQSTSLDEYFAIGVPDHFENKINEIIRELKQIGDTRLVETNEVLSLELLDGASIEPVYQNLTVNDPLAAQQWGWLTVQGNEVQSLWKAQPSLDLKESRIYILDTGIESKHEDISPDYRSLHSGSDSDKRGHGTHCAGIAAAKSNNGIGISSLLPDSRITVTSIKVLSDSGFGTQKQIVDGIIQAADNQASVISLSLGGPSNETTQKLYEEAVRYANSKGSIVIVAAGNNNQKAKQYSPANVNGVITVASVDRTMSKSSFSNTLEGIEYPICAPGTDILSAFPGNQYKSMSGTSMATPFVAGLVGILKSINPNLDTKEIHSILTETGKPIDGKNTGNLIQAKAAIESLID